MMINGRSETLGNNNAVACGNGGISTNAATSDMPKCDPEV